MDHTVLIVDDSPTAGPELRSILEHEGYTVLTALRGEEALDMLRTSHVDLIISEAVLAGIDGYELVRRIRQESRWMAVPIVMLTIRSTAEDYAAGFDAGANEYFVKPMEAPKLLAATRGLITRSQQAIRVAGAHADARPPAHLRSERGEIITVFSLKGGVGTSTIAVNLAVAIKQIAPTARVGLVDLALEQGVDALLLDVVPTSTILEWVREHGGESTPYLLNQYFVQHRTGISVLAAPPAPEDAETVRPEAVRATLELAREVFDYIVVDTASSFHETSLVALEAADSLVLPLTPDMAALKTSVSTLRILNAVNISEDKYHFVLNEIVAKAGLTKEQVESSVRHDTFVIPHAGALFIEAANHGMPLTSLEPPPPAARAIIQLAAKVCNIEAPVSDKARAGVNMDGLRSAVGRLGRLGRT